MWALIKSLIAQWAVLKILLKSLGSLAWLIPFAFILKFIGLPVLIVLAIVAVPLLIILAIVGLPIMFAVAAGALLLVGLFALLSFGIAVLKIAIPIIIIYWILKWAFGNKKTGDGTVEG